MSSVRTYLAVALLAFALPCATQEPNPLTVTMKPLESVGEADEEFTRSLWSELMRAIEKQSDFRVVSGGPTRYHLKGQVLVDDKRHLVTLQLSEAQTNRMLWLGNYDYRETNADTMADDVIAELYSALNFNAWE